MLTGKIMIIHWAVQSFPVKTLASRAPRGKDVISKLSTDLVDIWLTYSVESRRFTTHFGHERDDLLYPFQKAIILIILLSVIRKSTSAETGKRDIVSLMDKMGDKCKENQDCMEKMYEKLEETVSIYSDESLSGGKYLIPFKLTWQCQGSISRSQFQAGSENEIMSSDQVSSFL